MTGCTAIFDIGKTNKKICLFDGQYDCVYEHTQRLTEITDEDGFPCEDLDALRKWIFQTLDQFLTHKDFFITAVNVAAYGASLVYLDKNNVPVAPLYNYLKPYPPALLQEFLETHDSDNRLTAQTAAAISGALNSGLQLYRIKKEQPALFNSIHRVLHLPEYLASLISEHQASGMPSIGCHTALWDFDKNAYHHWVREEKLTNLFASIETTNKTHQIIYGGQQLRVGNGIHDSSAALIPYQLLEEEPFILVSTGSWCVCLNPFNTDPLSRDELAHNCLCYLDYQGKPVKAHRSPAGFTHDEKVVELARRYGMNLNHYKLITAEMLPAITTAGHDTYEQGYFESVREIIQAISVGITLIMTKPVRQLLISGGFAGNPVFTYLLQQSFPTLTVKSAEIGQASALGAAMLMNTE